jgi:tRNA (mo5U34)-methyltransferase
MQSVNVLEQKSESKIGKIIQPQSDFMLEVNTKNSWDGVRIVFESNQDNIYRVEFEAGSSEKNCLLEIILPTEKREYRICSFILESSKKLQFIFTPMHNSNSISFRISSYGGYSPGKIEIKKLHIFNLFPISDHEDLKQKIKIIGPWFHQIDLDGIKTRDVSRTDSPSRPGGFIKHFTMQDFIDNPIWIWSKFKDSLPQYLSGYRILDIACNSGFYSFELTKRGATVIGIDNSYEDIVRAKFAKKVLGQKNVNFEIINVDDLETEFSEKFDMVLCLGLLYHVNDPKRLIQKVSKITDFAFFETIANVKSQSAELIDDRSITSDGYLPTIPWLIDSFKEAGFTKIEQITKPDFSRVVFRCKKDS